MSLVILVAMIPPILWASINHIDKFAVDKYMKGRDAGSLVIFTGIAAIVTGVIVYAFKLVAPIASTVSFPMIAAGTMLVFSYIPYLYAMKNDEASNVAPLFQLITPCAYIFSVMFLDEKLSGLQLFAGSMIFLGALVLSFDPHKSRIRSKTFFLMLLGASMIALNIVMFKAFAISTDFWTSVFYDLVGAAVAGILLFSLIKTYRVSFLEAIREHGFPVIGVNMFAETTNIVARMISGSVTLVLPIAIIQFVNGLQPFFIIIVGILLTKFAPKLGKEAISKKILVQKFGAVALMVVGFVMLSVIS